MSMAMKRHAGKRSCIKAVVSLQDEINISSFLGRRKNSFAHISRTGCG